VSAEPARTLSPKARWIWRGEQLLGWGIVVAVAMLVATQLDGVLATLARVLPVAGLIVCVIAVPMLRWRNWRWDVAPQAIDIRHGTFVVLRTLIPMLRVQHVETSQDAFERALDLATVRVHTAAGSHRIPLLARRDADALRDRIADLARTADGP
jgi:membrane protein YdbS with pleckstrin-like domain